MTISSRRATLAAVVGDAELVLRAAAADPEAVAALYDRYAAPLLGVAMRVLHVRSDAEDVVHDLFVSLPDRARYYAPERGTVTAWLIVMARNLSIDRHRRRMSREKALVVPDAKPPEDTPDVAAGVYSRGDQLRRALEALPELQRATLYAAFFEGLTHAQIAERYGVPLGTIKSRCSRAIAVLREALGEQGLSADDLG